MKKAVQLLLFTVALAGFALANDAPTQPQVPEIDASSAVGAVGLLAGATLLFKTRRKK
ncbi:MAG TPA: hypothetical protein VLM42_19290 [Bryobacteraceae bacterium]|nr:hypothetical protein [Bryobacteraceae bacterium]